MGGVGVKKAFDASKYMKIDNLSVNFISDQRKLRSFYAMNK